MFRFVVELVPIGERVVIASQALFPFAVIIPLVIVTDIIVHVIRRQIRIGLRVEPLQREKQIRGRGKGRERQETREKKKRKARDARERGPVPNQWQSQK